MKRSRNIKNIFTFLKTLWIILIVYRFIKGLVYLFKGAFSAMVRQKMFSEIQKCITFSPLILDIYNVRLYWIFLMNILKFKIQKENCDGNNKIGKKILHFSKKVFYTYLRCLLDFWGERVIAQKGECKNMKFLCSELSITI